MSAVGEVVSYRGQRYEFLRFEPYTRRDSTLSTVAVWRSNCASCCAEFELITPARQKEFKAVRTCPEHRGQLRFEGGGRVAWRDRVKETEPAPLEPGMRPHAPIAAYDGARR